MKASLIFLTSASRVTSCIVKATPIIRSLLYENTGVTYTLNFRPWISISRYIVLFFSRITPFISLIRFGFKLKLESTLTSSGFSPVNLRNRSAAWLMVAKLRLPFSRVKNISPEVRLLTNDSTLPFSVSMTYSRRPIAS